MRENFREGHVYKSRSRLVWREMLDAGSRLGLKIEVLIPSKADWRTFNREEKIIILTILLLLESGCRVWGREVSIFLYFISLSHLGIFAPSNLSDRMLRFAWPQQIRGH